MPRRLPQNQSSFLVCEATDSLSHFPANLDEDSGGGIRRDLPIINSPLEDGTEGRDLGIPYGLGPQSGFQQPRLPLQKIIRRQPGRVVMADERAELFQHPLPAVDRFLGRLLLSRPTVQQGLQRNRLGGASLRTGARRLAQRCSIAARAAACSRLPDHDLVVLWEAHCRYEFETRDVDATMATMVAEPYVNHVPTMTGGVGHNQLKRFYKYHFIGGNPPDTELAPISRTVGADQLVDEMLFKFTHTSEIDWMLPGVKPTGRRVEIPLIAIVRFVDGKVWDQASVLVQVGLLDPAGLPVAGI